MYKVTKKKHTKWEKVKASYNYSAFENYDSVSSSGVL